MIQPQELNHHTTSADHRWQSQIQELLAGTSPASKLAIVGLGHPLRGDDYVGSYIMKGVIKTNGEILSDRVYLFDAEDNLERVITRLSRIGLKRVVFIDACEMGARPGETKLLSVDETTYPFFTTHGIPLRVLAERLLTGCGVWVLAIQPYETGFGYDLSSELRHTANSVSKFIASNLTGSLEIV